MAVFTYSFSSLLIYSPMLSLLVLSCCSTDSAQDPIVLNSIKPVDDFHLLLTQLFSNLQLSWRSTPPSDTLFPWLLWSCSLSISPLPLPQPVLLIFQYQVSFVHSLSIDITPLSYFTLFPSNLIYTCNLNYWYPEYFPTLFSYWEFYLSPVGSLFQYICSICHDSLTSISIPVSWNWTHTVPPTCLRPSKDFPLFINSSNCLN